MNSLILMISVFLLPAFLGMSFQDTKPGYVVITFKKPLPEHKEQFGQYAQKAGEAGKEFGVKPLATAGAELLEGSETDQQVVVLEFPSVRHAKNWYTSESYQKAKELREGIVDFKVILLEGR